MNFRNVNKKIEQLTRTSQPTLAGWINRLEEPQPIRLGKRKLGACAANSENNKAQKIDDSLVKFENKVREENIKFNRNSPKFRGDDQTIQIKAVNVNSVISFQKRNKIVDLLNDDPEILAITDTRVKEHKMLRFRNKTRNVFSTNTDQTGVAIIAKRTLNPKLFARDEEEGNFLTLNFMNVGKKYGIIAIYGPNDDDEKFWSDKIDKLMEAMRNDGTEKLIICGDLNILLGKQLGYAGAKLKKKTELLKLIDKHNIEDTANNQVDCNKLNAYSFWRRKQDKRINNDEDDYQVTRLDHFLTDLPQNESTRAGHKSWKLNPQVIDYEETMKKLVRIYKKLSKNLMKRISQIEMSSLPERVQAKKIRDIAYEKWKSVLRATKAITNT